MICYLLGYTKGRDLFLSLQIACDALYSLI